jgi:hypothetical protein
MAFQSRREFVTKWEAVLALPAFFCDSSELSLFLTDLTEFVTRSTKLLVCLF